MDDDLQKATIAKVGGNPRGIVMLCLVCSYEWNHDFGETGTKCPLCESQQLVESDAFRDAMICRHYQAYFDE